MVEFQHQCLRIATRLSRRRDSVGCITAILSRPNNFQLQTNLRQDRREIHAWILADKLSLSFPGCSERFEDHAIQSAAVQEKASSIETRRRLVLMNHKGSFPDRRLMPLPAHSASADHPVEPKPFCSSWLIELGESWIVGLIETVEKAI